MSRRVLLVCTVLAACDRPTAQPQPVLEAAKPGASLFAGGRRSCTIREGALRCWGDANHGALGTGVVMSASSVPTVIAGLDAVVAVALGESHGCASGLDGTVRCWGSNEYGALGNGGAGEGSPTPVAVPGLAGVTQLVAHGHQTCALANGQVWCWGDRHARVPTAISGLADVRQVALGEHHGCARLDSGVSCWGANDHGQLGSPGEPAGLVAVPGLGPVDEIAAAGDYTCARTAGVVRCWGDGDAAQLGRPDRKDSPSPRPIDGLADATALALGPAHACALRSSGAVACWGGSDRSPFGYPRTCPEGQTGQNLSPGTSGVMQVYCAAPMPVDGLADVVALVHGETHACAQTRAGALQCWGGGGYGELGNRDHGNRDSAAPIAVSFPAARPTTPSARAVAVAAQGEWSCAVLADRSVRCWGASSLGQLGPDVKNASATPVAIAGLGDVADLALGSYHGCARTSAGGVRCWGFNGNANLGDGTVDARREPVTPTNLPEVTALSASNDAMGAHTCALTKDRSVWCWGDNRAGQALPGGPQRVAPTQVPDLADVSQVVAGQAATCVLLNGVARCWGTLRTSGSQILVGAPPAIDGVDRLVELGMGYQVFCGRRDDDSVWCWGTRQDAGTAPKQVDLRGPARSLAVGSYGAAALRADGTLLTWGIESTTAPITETVLPGLTSIASSGSHTCALDDQGRVHCLGWNMNGQLGNPDQGTGGESKVPTLVAL